MRNLIAFTTTTAISMIAISAQAADKASTINEWVKQAGSAIEEKMEYPKTAAMTGETDTHTFVVTVNRQGDILEITKGDKVKRNYFDSASNRALRYVDLPDLPASYEKDTLSFALVLDYSNDQDEPEKRDANKLSDRQVLALSGGKAVKGQKETIDGF